MSKSRFTRFLVVCGSLLLLLPAVSRAQLTFTTNNNTITITGYEGDGLGVALVIPAMTNGYPVVNIADSAFTYDYFSSAVIPDSVTNIGDSAFYYCLGLNSVEFGSNVVTIGGSAFYGTSQLSSVTIPNSVVSIGEDAFALCDSYFGGANIIIGSGVTNIGELAFDACSASRIVFLGNAPAAGANAFSGDAFPVYYLPAKSGWGRTLSGYPVTPWFPKIVTTNSDFGVLTNGFGFDINWAANQTVFVDASTDLTTSNWVPLATNTLAPSDTIGDGAFYFSDPTWSNFPSRFYRVRAQ